MKSVSVIIPNYNGQLLLAKHLPAVLKMMNDQDQLVVVDDCSNDTSVELLKKMYQLKAGATEANSKEYQVFSSQYSVSKKEIKITLVQNKQNIRFAASCNRGATFATNELLFLLNSDVEPSADVLSYLVPHFNDPKVFGVGCLEEEQLNGRIVLSGKNNLQFKRGMFIHNRAGDMLSGETAWVSGGSGLFDKQKWNILKGFDVAYSPAYWEDVDLSFRANERGWKILFESNAKVKHNHESTNSLEFGQQKMQKMSWRNANYFVVKNGTWFQKIQYLLWQPYWQWKLKNNNSYEN